MQITIKPYFRSVIIDGEEVREMVTPFPDFLNHLAAVSCEASDTSPHTITRVEGVHRYVTHFIAREYYYEHIGEFIDWFYIEKQAQLDKAVADQAYLEQTVTDVIDPQLTQITQTITSNEIRSLYYNTNLRTLNAVKGNSTLTANIPLASPNTAGLMTEADFISFKNIEREVNNVIKKGSWKATYTTYEDMLEANPDLRVQDSSWEVGDFVYVQNDDHYDPDTVHTTSYSVTAVLGSDVYILAFSKVEPTSVTINPATITSYGVGRVATLADMEPGATVVNGPAVIDAKGGVITPTPTPNAVPQADANGKLDAWVSPDAGKANNDLSNLEPAADEVIRSKMTLRNLGTRSTTGDWTLTGCAPNIPLMVSISAYSNAYARFSRISGFDVTDAVAEMIYLGKETTNSIGCPTVMLRPIASTVVITIGKLPSGLSLTASQ